MPGLNSSLNENANKSLAKDAKATDKSTNKSTISSEVFPNVNFLNPDQKENSLRDPDKSNL